MVYIRYTGFVRAPSMARTPAPRDAAIDNLARVPDGLWVVIILVACGLWLGAVCVFLRRKRSKKPKKTEEIP